MIFDFNAITSYMYKRNIKIGDKKQQLHKWFAWYPIEIGYCKWVWLNMVFRKYKSHDMGIGVFTKRYREPEYFEINYIDNIRKEYERST